MVAIKIIREEFIAKDPEGARKAVCSEVLALQSLKHNNIIKIFEYGDNGEVFKPTSGRTIGNLVYMVLEYVKDGLLLFDLCQLVGSNGGFGEE